MTISELYQVAWEKVDTETYVQVVKQELFSWLARGQRIQLEYPYDWDRSGEEVEIEEDLVAYARKNLKTVGDWGSELTGNWIATYESGMGKRWETFYDAFDYFSWETSELVALFEEASGRRWSDLSLDEQWELDDYHNGNYVDHDLWGESIEDWLQEFEVENGLRVEIAEE